MEETKSSLTVGSYDDPVVIGGFSAPVLKTRLITVGSYDDPAVIGGFHHRY